MDRKRLTRLVGSVVLGLVIGYLVQVTILVAFGGSTFPADFRDPVYDGSLVRLFGWLLVSGACILLIYMTSAEKKKGV